MKTCAWHRGDLPRSRHGPPCHRSAGDPFSKPQPPLDCPFCLPELKFISLLLLFFNFLLWKNFKYSKIEILMP